MSLMMAPPCAKAPRPLPSACRSRRGSALVYVTASMVALLAFVSLAVDLGHVYVVRSELQTAADAAARYGVTGIESGVATAQSYAANAASENKSDGVGVVIDATTDIEFGKWDKAARTFTVLTGAARSGADAMRVTARRTAATNNAVSLLFARVLGKTSQDVRAQSIAFIDKPPPRGITGLAGITFKNNTFVGSYNSATNTNPTENTSGSQAYVGSNGAITGGGNNTVSGSATLGPSAPNTVGITFSGTTTRLTTPIETPVEPAWSPSTNPGGVPQNYTVSGTVTIPGGTYWFTSLTVKGTLKFSGAATLYVKGPIVVGGALYPYNMIPGNLRIYQIGKYDFGDDDINGADIVADIIAPEADFLARNNLIFRGRMIVNSIVLQNNGDLFYDVALGGSTGGGKLVTTVR